MFDSIRDKAKAVAMAPKVMARMHQYVGKNDVEVKALLVDKIKTYKVHEFKGTMTEEIEKDLEIEFATLSIIPFIRLGYTPAQEKIIAFLEECRAEADNQLTIIDMSKGEDDKLNNGDDK